MRPSREDALPWYRQFWPWFLISLPAAVVLASMATIFLAVSSDDGLVKDDYYREGLAIHRDAARVEAARQLGLKGRLTYREQQGEVLIEINDAPIGHYPELELQIVHPTRPNRDQTVAMTPVAPNHYRGRLDSLEPGNWRLSWQIFTLCDTP